VRIAVPAMAAGIVADDTTKKLIVIGPVERLIAKDRRGADIAADPPKADTRHG